MKLIFASFGTQRKEEGDAGAVTLADTAPPVCWLLVLWAPSGDTASVLPLFFRSCRALRCPSQTERHPQLPASCHDCSSCSNCLLLLWSLRLRCQGW